MRIHLLLCISVVLLTLVNKSSAINCYYCNSANNSACLDLSQYDEDDLARIIPIVDCEKAIPSSVRLNFFCRKIIQTTCLDLSQYDEDDLARIIPIVDCEKAIPSSVRLKFFCRKIIQTIYHAHSHSSVRVTRSCGWVPSKQPCYHTSNRDHLETVCQCFDNMCNAAEHVDPTSAAILFLSLAFVLYFFRD